MTTQAAPPVVEDKVDTDLKIVNLINDNKAETAISISFPYLLLQFSHNRRFSEPTKTSVGCRL